MIFSIVQLPNNCVLVFFDICFCFFDIHIINCNADITSKNPRKVARLHSNFELVKTKLVEVEAKDAIRNFKNPITGDYVMELFALEPCNIIGQLKEAVKNAILDGVIENSFEAADVFMRERAAEMGLTPVR